MAERLREVADQCPGGRIDLLREQTKRVAPRARRRVQVRRLVNVSLVYEVLDEPETAQEERAFLAGQPIGRLVMPVAVQQAVASREPLPDRGGRGDHAGMIGR